MNKLELTREQINLLDNVFNYALTWIEDINNNSMLLSIPQDDSPATFVDLVQKQSDILDLAHYINDRIMIKPTNDEPKIIQITIDDLFKDEEEDED